MIICCSHKALLNLHLCRELSNAKKFLLRTPPRSLQIERSYKVQSFFVRSKPSVTRRQQTQPATQTVANYSRTTKREVGMMFEFDSS